MAELFDVVINNSSITANGVMVNLPSVSGTFALVADVQTVANDLSAFIIQGNNAVIALQNRDAALQAQITAVSAADLNKVDLSTDQSIGGNKTFEDPVHVNDNLYSLKYIMGSGPDLSCIPVVGGQSVISTWWGLQLAGNRQSAVDYTPANIGAAGEYNVVIPATTNSTSAVVMIREVAGQSIDCLQIQDNSGNVLSRIRANGNFGGDVDYTPTTSASWINQPSSLDSALDELGLNWFSNRRIIIQDDFIYNTVPGTAPAGPAGFSADTANGGSLTMVTTTTEHIGVIALNTGTSNNSTGRSALSMGVATVMPTGTIIYEAMVMFPTLSTATVEYTNILGLSDTQTATPNNGIYFIYDRLAAGSNIWRIATAAGGTRTLTNTAITIVANTWYKVKFVAKLTGTKSVNFYINDVLIGTITANIPTLVTGIRAQMLKNSSSATSSIARLDYINIAIDYPAR